MTRLRIALVCLMATVIVAEGFGTAQADDQTAGLNLIETAIRARGGESRLTTYAAETGKLTGTYAGQPFACVYWILPPNRWRYEMKLGDSAVAGVVDGSTGWFIRLSDNTAIDMTASQLAESRESLHAGWLESLLPLKGKDFVLTKVGEITIAGELAVGIRVSSKGHADVTLYFDMASGLLVKTERRIRDAEQRGKEVIEETILSRYEEVRGVKISMKQVITHDGKPFAEWSRTEVELLESLDDKFFKKPNRN
jgi:hypothetical protein